MQVIKLRSLAVLVPYMLVLILIGCNACNKSSSETSSQGGEWMEFGKAIVAASNNNDANKLLHDFSATDLDQFNAFLQEFGQAVPSGQELEDEKQDTEKQMRVGIETFLKSYDYLFDGQVVKVVAVPLLLPQSRTEEERRMNNTFQQRFQPQRVIIWVQKDDHFRGMLIPVVYQTQSSIKVVLWQANVGLMSYATGVEMVKQRASLERWTLRDCDFPAEIKFDFWYTDGTHGSTQGHSVFRF